MAKPWKKPAATFDGAHADHLLIGVDLVAAAGGEAGGGGDRVGQRHQRDADRGEEQRSDIGGARPGDGRRGHALGQRTGDRDPLGRQVEHRRDDGGADDGHEHRRDLGGEPGQHQQQREHGDAEHERRPVGLVEVGDELADLVDEPVGVGGEAEQLGELADDDGDGQAVHVADLDLLGEQAGDEAELAEARGRSR